MILVTGSTGTIGSHMVRLLAERGPPFRAMSRHERPGGVRADFDDPASLARAVADVDTVFLVTVPPCTYRGPWHCLDHGGAGGWRP
ncbi:NAD-dependent epimerase/dehydratase family protein [Streptomyces sp. SID5643]|uniref:SDR family oxidoreductase n=1 Tax=Streptomyces sp. SID5643 TaxID=2690307 RepID=UPI002351932E|nr:NAD-dependent epimerase/dehydratase family protein [Streptomyces sp. SID5643]